MGLSLTPESAATGARELRTDLGAHLALGGAEVLKRWPDPPPGHYVATICHVQAPFPSPIKKRSHDPLPTIMGPARVGLWEPGL